MSSIIFIGSSSSDKHSLEKHSFRDLFCVPPLQILQRIYGSFVPPITKKCKIVHVDLVGPACAILILTALLVYGQSFKIVSPNNISISPASAVLLYTTLAPPCCYFLCKMSQSCIGFCEVCSLVGYSLYGHIFTILIAFGFDHETSNMFFFFCMIFICGFSTLRLVVVLLKTIPLPGMRLIVCSTTGVTQILYLIFIHFAYMHRTFVYGRGVV